MYLPTKRASNHLFGDELANVADEMLLHGQKRLVFEAKFFPGGVVPPSPNSGYGPAKKNLFYGIRKEGYITALIAW